MDTRAMTPHRAALAKRKNAKELLSEDWGKRLKNVGGQILPRRYYLSATF